MFTKFEKITIWWIFTFRTTDRPLVAKELILAIDAVLPTGWGSKGHERLQAVIFVEELSDILAESLPDLWKLGNEYLSGSLFHKVGDKNWAFICGQFSLFFYSTQDYPPPSPHGQLTIKKRPVLSFFFINCRKI